MTTRSNWKDHNLEHDLKSTDWIVNKVCTRDAYAQNLYAGLCNNEFTKRETWALLKDERWSCSWRYAGGIIANIRQDGDYMDWYCSGIQSADETGYVPESIVTEEIKDDLYELGWMVIEDRDTYE